MNNIYTLSILNALCLKIKAWIFKKRISKYRETGNSKLITDINFSTFGTKLLVFLLWCIIIFGLFIILFAMTVLCTIFILWVFKQEKEATNVTALVVGILSIIGVIYAANRKRKDENRDRFDTAIYIILQFLIEAKRGNFNYKIYKEDLSHIFMNVPNTILFILRDIQNNIQKTDCLKESNEKDLLDKVINKEILFLITFIRDSYRITEVELEKNISHESIIDDLINYCTYSKSDKISNKKDCK